MRKVKSTLFQNLESVAVVLRALSNSSRLRITLALLHAELSVATLEESLEIKQPNLSQQLAELRKAGILEARRSAKSVFYSIADQNVRDVIALIAASMDNLGGVTLSQPAIEATAAAVAAAAAARPALDKPAARMPARPAAARTISAAAAAADTEEQDKAPAGAPIARPWQGEEAQFAKVWPMAHR
ncbi:ArsR family transcriptional regulator [Oxalobacteraceae bacterium CAVE-383]|nr:ArsR family transcriptional regulator [Oxalobacteraceae bacterium CAVE-383]